MGKEGLGGVKSESRGQSLEKKFIIRRGDKTKGRENEFGNEERKEKKFFFPFTKLISSNLKLI